MSNTHDAKPTIAPNPSTRDYEVYYLRITLFYRILHFVVVTSFLGLVLTGMPLKFSSSPIVAALSPYLGGIETARYLHRVFAVVTFLYFGFHLIHIAQRYLLKKEKGIFWGPNSMVPQPKDLLDLIQHFKWFLHLGPRPKFGRFTYWEKFDYWAVFWGVGMIGVSGLFLWFPTFFGKYFPGWIFNVAVIIHSDEALLASGFIFIIHFFNTHLRPTKFPLDHVIITGRISREEMLYEHPLEHEQLLKDGGLEHLHMDPPPRWMKNLSKTIGFTAIGLGISTIILILWVMAGTIPLLMQFFKIALPLIAAGTLLYILSTDGRWKKFLRKKRIKSRKS